MKTSFRIRFVKTAVCSAALLAGVVEAAAHCDTLDGPVVKAGQRALAERNVNHALIWVQEASEAEFKRVFEKTLAVRALGPTARELADLYFFETLVRLHRAGEGAPYTGLKPAGLDLGPALPAGDKALETGDLVPVAKLITAAVDRGLHEHFRAVREKKAFPSQDVAAGRAFVKDYVRYIHYVEALHLAATTAVHAHPDAKEHAAAHAPGESDHR